VHWKLSQMTVLSTCANYSTDNKISQYISHENKSHTENDHTDIKESQLWNGAQSNIHCTSPWELLITKINDENLELN